MPTRDLEKRRQETARYRDRHPRNTRYWRSYFKIYRTRRKTNGTYKKLVRTPEQVRAANYKHLYGISIADYEAKLATQNYRCAICHTLTPGGHGRFHVDHDPVTKQVRGLLCVKCNHDIRAGSREDAVRLRTAVAYVEHWL